MNRACPFVVLAVTLCFWSVAQAQREAAPSRRTSKLNAYFERFCDEDGAPLNKSLSPGYENTYDSKFRQQLKKTQDVELKRLLVLRHLYSEVDANIYNFSERNVAVDMETRRPMTPIELASLHANILEELEDLSEFDPGDPLRQIAEFKDRLKRAEAKHSQ